MQLDSINYQIDCLYDGVLTIEKEDEFDEFKMNLKELLFQMKDSIEQRMKIKNDSEFFNQEFLRLGYKKREKISAIEKKMEAVKSNAFHLSFWSFGYSAKREDFKLLKDSVDFGQQLRSEDYTSHTIRAAFNLASNLKNIKDKSKLDYSKRRFVSIGAAFSYTNNLTSLKQVEVIDSKLIDSTNRRVKNVKQNAFEGDYKRDISSLRLLLDYYSFLKKDENSIALHFNPEVVISEFQKPVAFFQFGVLVPFKKKGEEGIVVNLEIFYRLRDIFNSSDSVNSLLNRNQIGFQTTFPFNF